jgi:beta-lactamase regulating signal transducer with metallopeptidase domain
MPMSPDAAPLLTDTEVLSTLLRANAAVALSVLLVIAMRWPMRRAFGPGIAYGLWILPPIVFLASLLPPPIMRDAPTPDPFAVAQGHAGSLLFVWLLGLAGVILGLTAAQLRYCSDVRQGRGGPSVIGIIAPRILMPADDGAYSPQERELIRIHEREHVRRGDPRARATAAAFQALCWFNPLVHLGAHLMRLDQELACDSAVLRRRPGDRALYAQTLLKTQLKAQALPFGCHWPPNGRHPLETRVAALSLPTRQDGLAGPLLLATAMISAALAAWAGQPPGERQPPPLIAAGEEAGGRTISVLLIRTPARDPAAAATSS